MDFFRNFSVRAKLFSGFGAVLVVAVIVGVVLMTQMGNVNSGGVYLGTNALPSVETIGLVDSATGDFRTDQLNYILESNSAAMAQLVSKWQAADAAVQADLTKYQSMLTNAQDRTDWNAVKSAWAAYKAQTANVQAVGRSGVNAASLAAVRNSTGVYNSLQAAVDKWRKDNLAWADQKVKSNASTYSSAKTIGIVLLAIAVMLGLGIAFVVSRSIKRNATSDHGAHVDDAGGVQGASDHGVAGVGAR